MLRDRGFMRNLRALAGHTPPGAETADALAKARWALRCAAEQQRAARLRWIARRVIPASVAACLVAAALWFWRPNAVAARDFHTAAASASMYRAPLRVVAAIHDGKGTQITCYANGPAGTGFVRQSAADTLMIFASARGAYDSYSPGAAAVSRGDLPIDLPGIQRQVLLPADVAAALASLPALLGHDASCRAAGRDASGERIDVSLFRSVQEEQKFRAEASPSAANVPADFSAWLNDDQSMTRLDFDGASGPVTEQITYGGPGAGSIYDLGAPRSVRVVDQRPTGGQPGEYGSSGHGTNERAQQEHEQQEHESSERGERGRD